MPTFKERVEYYTGTISDNDALSGWLSQAARMHVRITPQSELIKYATEKSVPVSGMMLDGIIVLSVDKAGTPSIEYPSNMKARLTDANSIHKATEFTPAHVVRSGRLYVYPGGGTAEVVEFPDVSHNDTSISVLPDDLEDATVLLATLQQVVSGYSGGGSSGSSDLKGIDLTSEFSQVDTRLSDDDIELSRARLEKINAMLQEFASEMEASGQMIQSLQFQYNNLVSPYMQRD